MTMVEVKVVGTWNGVALDVISVEPQPDVSGIAPALTALAREVAVKMAEGDARASAEEEAPELPAKFIARCFLSDKLFLGPSA